MGRVIQGKPHAFDGAGVVFMPQRRGGCQTLQEVEKEQGESTAAGRAAASLVQVAGAFLLVLFWVRVQCFRWVDYLSCFFFRGGGVGGPGIAH